MSFDIGGVGQVPGAAPARSPAAAAQRAPVVSGTSTDQEAVAVDTFPAGPPAEVSDAIGVAARSYDDLAASGRRLHFAVDPPSGRLTVELHDLSGNLLSAVTPRQVLDVAGGADLR